MSTINIYPELNRQIYFRQFSFPNSSLVDEVIMIFDDLDYLYPP